MDSEKLRIEANEYQFKSKLEGACLNHFIDLLENENVQAELWRLGCRIDLNDRPERVLIARCMAEAAPAYIIDYLADNFDHIYQDTT